ncbi:MAG: RidA family protein [Zetaproteobacteria bacterium]|nr:MAG: RidA family protein [Zetaproteobacteria bacterium]
MTITTIDSEAAPAAVGPYSHAVRHGNTLYLSGQIGLDPASGTLVPGGVTAETQQILRNLDAVLATAGASRTQIVKATIYLVEMEDFRQVNAIYGDWLGNHRPARATVAVARLPLDARIEIDLVVAL